MGEYKEQENDKSFRDVPANPKDGEEFVIEADGKIIKAVWNAAKRKWKRI